MKSKTMMLIVLLMTFVLAFSSCAKAPDVSENLSMALSAADAQKILCGGDEGKLLSTVPAGTPICDWTAMAFKLLEIEDDYDFYLEELEKFVTQKYVKEGKLDRAKATEWHRVALTVLALGGNPKEFGTDAEGNKINLIKDGTYGYINDDLGEQGINGFIYALMTLDASGCEVPDGSKYTKESIIDAIISAQNEDGGFGFSKGKSDVDMTAMALHAIAKHRDIDKVDESAEKAIEYLSEVQDGDGAYSGMGGKSSEACSQVIIALCANKIDPRTDERFIKHGKSLYDAFLTFQISDGSFIHTYGDKKGASLTTEQALLAFVAVENFDNGKYGIFEFGK